MCFDEWDQNSAALSDEVQLIERIQAKWGKDMVYLMQQFYELNADGQTELINLAECLTEVRKYKK